MSASTRFNNEIRYRPEGHEAQTAITPDYLLEPIREALGGSIDLDPCTTPDNPCGATTFYTPPGDGAAEPWTARSIYVNPPYGQARERWVARCALAATSGSKVVLLIPAHTDTRAFQRAAASASVIVFIKGRVKFGVLRPNLRQVAASHPSALLCWNVDATPLLHLGFAVTSRSATTDCTLPAFFGHAWCDHDIALRPAGSALDQEAVTE